MMELHCTTAGLQFDWFGFSSSLTTYLPTYLPSYQPTNLPTYLPTYQPTYLQTNNIQSSQIGDQYSFLIQSKRVFSGQNNSTIFSSQLFGADKTRSRKRSRPYLPIDSTAVMIKFNFQ